MSVVDLGNEHTKFVDNVIPGNRRKNWQVCKNIDLNKIVLGFYCKCRLPMKVLLHLSFTITWFKSFKFQQQTYFQYEFFLT